MVTHPNDKFITHNIRHNVIVNALDGLFFWFGYSFYSPNIILPVFITRFTDNPIVLGLIPFLSTAGYLVPQLFTSKWVEQEPVKKRIPVNYGFFLERVPVALLVPATLLFADANPTLTIVATIFLFSWHTFGAGMILVGWQDMIAKIIPTDLRGRFLGTTNFLGMGSGIAGAAAVSWMLGILEFPTGYVWAFAIGAGLNFFSWFFLSLSKEPPDTNTKVTTPFSEYLKKLPHVVRENLNFRRYLLTQIIIAIGGMANGFLIVYAVQHWSLPDHQAAAYTIAFMVGQALANPLMGLLADKKGYKLILEPSALTGILSLVLAVFSPDPLWFFAVFFLRGVNASGYYLGGISIAMEFSDPENRPTFIGLANTIPGIAGGIAPLVGGWLALMTGYPFLFAVSAAIALLGFSMLRWFVREPRFAKEKPLPISDRPKTS